VIRKAPIPEACRPDGAMPWWSAFRDLRARWLAAGDVDDPAAEGGVRPRRMADLAALLDVQHPVRLTEWSSPKYPSHPCPPWAVFRLAYELDLVIMFDADGIVIVDGGAARVFVREQLDAEPHDAGSTS